MNLNGSKTEINTLSLKKDKRLDDLETVSVGPTIVKKSDHRKYLGVTIDKHPGFQTHFKKMLKIWQSVCKTVETLQHRFPTGVLLMLFHALVMSHLDYFLLFFFKISSSLLLLLEKQINWVLQSVLFSSNVKSFYELRKTRVYSVYVT